MTRQSRRIAAIAGVAGAGVGALGALTFSAGLAVLTGEAKLARRRIPQAVDRPPRSHATVWVASSAHRRRPPVRLTFLGDSTAAGYGARRDRDTPAAQVALGISAATRRPVHVTNLAVVGAESAGLAEQLERMASASGDIAVILVGANDVTHRIKQSVAVGHLREAVAELRARGTDVVVGTCPDLGCIRPLPQPLRGYARRLSRRLAAAQTVAVVEAGGRTVSLGDLLGPVFESAREMFADDQFHPSSAGYRHVAEVLTPTCLDLLGVPTFSTSASAFTTRMRKPLARAAAQAAARPGSEVAPARSGRSRIRLGQLRRRRVARAYPRLVPLSTAAALTS